MSLNSFGPIGISTLLPGVHPVLRWEPSHAAGELHHPGAQTDREPAEAPGERWQNPLMHGPCYKLLPRGQRHRQDHQRGVSLGLRLASACIPGLSTFNGGYRSCRYSCKQYGRNKTSLFLLRPTGRLDEYLACIAKIQKAVEYFQDNNPDSPELNTVVPQTRFPSPRTPPHLHRLPVGLSEGQTVRAPAVPLHALLCLPPTESTFWEGEGAVGGRVPRPSDPLQQASAPYPDPGCHRRGRGAGGPGGGRVGASPRGSAAGHHLHLRLAGGVRADRKSVV